MSTASLVAAVGVGVAGGVGASIGWIRWALEQRNTVKAQAKARDAEAMGKVLQERCDQALAELAATRDKAAQEQRRYEEMRANAERERAALEAEFRELVGEHVPAGRVADAFSNFGRLLPPPKAPVTAVGPEDPTPGRGVRQP